MSNFICPVCKSEISLFGRTYKCPNNHCFDLSKDGYVNLLMSQQSSLKRHGDDKLMVKARRDFLEKGFYNELRQALCETLKEALPEDATIVDVGCGEGYYTSEISKVNDFEIFGIDISKDALKYAAKSVKGSSFAVASAFSLPFAENSADCVLSVFAPSAYEEFSRVLKNDGKLIKAIPLENHLWELKCALYKEPYKNKPEKRNDELFKLVSQKEIKYKINLTEKEDIENLFKMTPYYYKTGREDAERLLSLESLETTVHFGVEVYEKR
ncbi:MAG: methyltransferase domain-containing protein [Acutalibacteraceae bacterium]|nr:methyltransferase domain-containing protein [Acutalibacteraceae bacterium]